MRGSSKRIGLEALEDRLALTTVKAIAGELIITGTNASETVRIADNGAGTVSGFATGYGTFSYANITKITVNMEGGSDTVSYNLMGDLKAGQKQYVTVGLGSDADLTMDRFNAYLYGHDIKANARLDLLVGGGGGMDTLEVNALGTDVALGGALKTTINGGNGEDRVLQRYSGENDGAIAFRSLGGQDSDVIFQQMTATAGSTGQLAGWVRGEAGAD